MAKTDRNSIMDSPKALVISAVIGLVLAYSLFTRAFDTGSLFQYSIVILFTILSIRFLIKAVQLKSKRES